MQKKLQRVSELLETVEKELEENEQLRKENKQTIDTELEHNRASFEELEKLKHDLETNLKEKERIKEAEIEAEIVKGKESLEELEVVKKDVVKYMEQYKDNAEFKAIFQDMVDEKQKLIEENQKLTEELEENKLLREKIDKMLERVLQEELRVFEENEALRQELNKELEELKRATLERINRFNEILAAERDIIYSSQMASTTTSDTDEVLDEIEEEPPQVEDSSAPKKESLWNKLKKRQPSRSNEK